MTLTLYLHPLASFSHKVLNAFYENDVPFESVTVDLLDLESAADFLAKWPVGKIPVSSRLKKFQGKWSRFRSRSA